MVLALHPPPSSLSWWIACSPLSCSSQESGAPCGSSPSGTLPGCTIMIFQNHLQASFKSGLFSPSLFCDSSTKEVPIRGLPLQTEVASCISLQALMCPLKSALWQPRSWLFLWPSHSLLFPRSSHTHVSSHSKRKCLIPVVLAEALLL